MVSVFYVYSAFFDVKEWQYLLCIGWVNSIKLKIL